MPTRPLTFTRRAAFTLLELLAAIAIVAVLATVLLTSLGPIRDSMRKAQCLNNMKHVAAATFVYLAEHDHRFPRAENTAWDIPLGGYLDVPEADKAIPVLKCPEDVRPLSPGPGEFARSYSFNANIPDSALQITQPSQTIMLAEWYTGASGPGGASHNFQYSASYNCVLYSSHVPSNTTKKWRGYHRDHSNFIFADGHAESLDPHLTVGENSVWTAQR